MVDELSTVEVPHGIFSWLGWGWFLRLGVEFRGFRAQERSKFGNAGARVVISISSIGVQHGAVEEVAAADG